MVGRLLFWVEGSYPHKVAVTANEKAAPEPRLTVEDGGEIQPQPETGQLGGSVRPNFHVEEKSQEQSAIPTR